MSQTSEYSESSSDTDQCHDDKSSLNSVSGDSLSSYRDRAPLPHLKILKYDEIHRPKLDTFHLFPKLPAEIRNRVWKCAMQQRRIITFSINKVEDPELDLHARRVEIAVRKGRTHSKYLRVCQESRGEALRFYRVHVPCRLVESFSLKQPLTEGTLYFNPEYDLLYGVSGASWGSDCLPDFMYRLETVYDPRHVGICNLGLDVNSMHICDIPDHENRPEIDPRIKEAYRKTVANLREVYFVSVNFAGRQNFGWYSGMGNTSVWFNRSYPLMAWGGTLDFLPSDPRPIGDDLKRVFTGTADVRTMPCLWDLILKRWQISPVDIQYRFMLAHGTDDVMNHETATAWLQREDDEWKGPTETASREHQHRLRMEMPAECLPKDGDKGLDKVARPAFGAWIFPIEAIGPFQEEGVPPESGFAYRPKRILDMSKHWPQLALSSAF